MSEDKKTVTYTEKVEKTVEKEVPLPCFYKKDIFDGDRTVYRKVCLQNGGTYQIEVEVFHDPSKLTHRIERRFVREKKAAELAKRIHDGDTGRAERIDRDEFEKQLKKAKKEID